MGSRKKSPAKKKMHVNEKPSAIVRKGKLYTMYDRAMAAYKKDRFRDLKSGETLYNWLSRMKKERQMLDTFLKEGGIFDFWHPTYKLFKRMRIIPFGGITC